MSARGTPRVCICRVASVVSHTSHKSDRFFFFFTHNNRYNFAAFYFPEIIAEWAAAEAAKQKQEAGQPGGGQQRPAFAPPRKILYLDTDVVVQGSVAELWDDLDLRGYPAAAVEDCSQTFKFGYFRDQYNKYDGAATFASGQPVAVLAEHLIATKALRLHSCGLDAHCR